MQRRRFIAGVAGAGVALAGCTGSSDPSDDDSSAPSTTDGSTSTGEELQELSETEALLDQHFATVGDLSFSSEERIEQSTSESDEARVEAYSVRNGDAGTRVTSEERTPNSDGERSETLWFTGDARISRDSHRYEPDGITPPFVRRQAVASIVDIAAFEHAEAAGDESVSVFEASSADEEVASEFEAGFETVDVRAEVAAAGYLRALQAGITFVAESDSEQTSTLSYDYEVSDVGDVSVSAPDFVDDAVRVEGSLTEDRSALVLEHTGGPVVAEETELVVQDHEYIAAQRPPTFQTTFEPGETAYVYWTSPEEAAVEVGEQPSEVAREFVLPSDDGDRGVYLQSRSHPGSGFEVAIDRQV